MPTLAAPTRLLSLETRRVASRFVWKEVRMLRGLAVGVVGLTLVEMAVSHLFLPAKALPTWMLVSAFGATALFAVAAAVTLFSVEREVGTTAFLEFLPHNRVAILAGKTLAAVLMTLVVLGALSGVTLVTGFWPAWAEGQVIVSQGSLAIVEGFVYGLLMSLICPQPLLAALLAIAAASLSSQLAMALGVDNAKGFTLQDFQQAAPARLAIAALIGTLDAWLGLHWLQRLSSPRRVRFRIVDTTKQEKLAKLRPRRVGMFGRLVWQSLRQSWKTALAATFIGLLLMFATETVLGTWFSFREHLPLSLLFVPALFGALAFRADQRQLKYRFLAEHVGRPRVIWLSRQLTWLAPTIAWCLVVQIIAWTWGSWWFLDQLEYLRWGNRVLGSSGGGRWTAAVQLTVEQDLHQWLHGTMVFWMASLAAYALGQFLSLAFRSDVFAGLLSLGGSIILLFWAYVVMAWQLPAVWFIGPLTIGLFLASWLRAPCWLIERRGGSHWILPALGVIVPAAAMLCYVPVERAAQVQLHYASAGGTDAGLSSTGTAAPDAEHEWVAWVGHTGPLSSSEGIFLSSIGSLAEGTRESQARGRALADQYIVLADSLDTQDTESKEQLDQQVIELSQRKGRLPPDLPHLEASAFKVTQYALARAGELQAQDLATSLEMLLAARRIEGQCLLALPFPAAWGVHRGLSNTGSETALLKWATAPDQTPDLLQQAIDELGEINRNWPNPSATVMNQYLAALAVVRGEEAPKFLRDDHADHLSQWLPYLANRFPGEASRAERALDILAACVLDYFVGVQAAVIQLDRSANERSAEDLRERLNSWYGNETIFSIVTDGLGGKRQWWQRARLVRAAQTSYLAAEEFVAFSGLGQYAGQWAADLAQRRAELVRLALLAYRLQHGEYPETLEQLVPDYLPEWEISDPYAAGPFQYRPEGFDQWIWNTSHYPKEWFPPHTPVLWSIGTRNASPTEEVVEFTYDESGERVPTERQPAEDLLKISSAEIHSESVIVLKNWGLGPFWLPLPAGAPSDSPSRP